MIQVFKWSRSSVWVGIQKLHYLTGVQELPPGPSENKEALISMWKEQRFSSSTAMGSLPGNSCAQAESQSADETSAQPRCCQGLCNHPAQLQTGDLAYLTENSACLGAQTSAGADRHKSFCKLGMVNLAELKFLLEQVNSGFLPSFGNSYLRWARTLTLKKEYKSHTSFTAFQLLTDWNIKHIKLQPQTITTPEKRALIAVLISPPLTTAADASIKKDYFISWSVAV